MTSLRRQLDVTLKKLATIKNKLQDCDEYPPCCLTIHRNNCVSCDTFGPMSEKVFLLHCEDCKKAMEELLDRISEFLQ